MSGYAACVVASPFELPEPGSDELAQILAPAQRPVYRYLFDRRDDPPTMAEIQRFLETQDGETRSQRGRRVRDLYPFFQIDKVGPRSRPKYLLRRQKSEEEIARAATRISSRLRAEVLQSQRCAQCGQTPTDHGVVLVVDHCLPKDWGGTDDVHNLQPLCEECNQGKKNLYATFADEVERIRLAANYDEPQRRIGELFLAFPADAWIDSSLLAAVANAKTPQEDWQRRLRDLRFIGWDYRFKTKKIRGRVKSYYQLTESAPWPGNMREAIAAEVRRRKSKAD